MPIHDLAGKPAPPSILINVPRLVSAYYTQAPDPDDPSQRVSFGTSGHRGSSVDGSFNEPHIAATTQALCAFRKKEGIDGPLFLAIDTHALSEPARITALEVLAANGVDVMIDADDGYTPTPVVSHAILAHNRSGKGKADGVVVTPSHNPPGDGGFKYNPPNGGPADKDATTWIQDAANELLAKGCQGVQRIPYDRALRAATTHRHDYVTPYVADLANVVDLEAIRSAGLHIGVDPMGSASIPWEDRVSRTGDQSRSPTASIST